MARVLRNRNACVASAAYATPGPAAPFADFAAAPDLAAFDPAASAVFDAPSTGGASDIFTTPAGDAPAISPLSTSRLELRL
jgi:hypothetical protein